MTNSFNKFDLDHLEFLQSKMKVTSSLTCATVVVAALLHTSLASKQPLVGVDRNKQHNNIVPSMTVFHPASDAVLPDVLKPFGTAPLSTFDDGYFRQFSAQVSFQVANLDTLDNTKEIMHGFARSLLLAVDSAASHAAKVASIDGTIFLTIAGPAVNSEHHTKNTQLVQSLEAIHDVVRSCSSAEDKANSASSTAAGLQRALAAATASNLTPLLACSKHASDGKAHAARHLTASKLNVAYPSDSFTLDHADVKRTLQAAHPAAGVHARRLSPPVFKNPLMPAARKTNPMYVGADGSRRYRMLSTAAHPAFGNITVGYDILLRPETLSLDDAAEVLTVTCAANNTMIVTSLHPLAIVKGETIIEAAKEWGCKLSQEAKGVHGVVAIVQDIASSVQPSGVIEYTLTLEETAPLAGAAVWDSFLAVQPPSDEERDAAIARRLISCPDATATQQGIGVYMILDCSTANSDFGKFDFNYDRASRSPVQARLPIAGLTDVWFDNTYATFTATFELKMVAYASSSGGGLPFFEAKFTASAAASITLMATESRATSSGWSDLTREFSSGSFIVSVGPLPVEGEATAKLVARKPSSSLSSITASVGASLSASAELGVRLSNRLEGGQGCYCVSACANTFTFPTPYCFLNEGCTASFVQPRRDGNFKWALCSSFSQQNNGWSLISDGSWDFQKQPPTVVSESGVAAGSSTYELGSRLGLTLYKLVPLTITPSYELRLNIASSGRSLRRDYAAHGRQLCSSQGSISAEVGKTNLESGIEDITLDVPFIGRKELVSGTTFPTTVVSSATTSTDPFPICNADGTPGSAPAAAGPGGGSPSSNGSDEDGGITTTAMLAVVGVVVVALIVGVVLYRQRTKKQQSVAQARSVPAPGANGAVQVQNPSAMHAQAHAPHVQAAMTMQGQAPQMHVSK